VRGSLGSEWPYTEEKRDADLKHEFDTEIYAFNTENMDIDTGIMNIETRNMNFNTWKMGIETRKIEAAHLK